MKQDRSTFVTLSNHLIRTQPDDPILYFNPETLRHRLAEFQRLFPGKVTFAVKANPDATVISNLSTFGIDGFDVASSAEIDLIRQINPKAEMHYNNPVRSKKELRHARNAGIKSYSIDRPSELTKLAEIVPSEGVEISVRLKLRTDGAAYDFGDKYGASPDNCIALLQMAKKLGFITSMTFHPGTQCTKADTWVRYIKACANISDQAGVGLHRLNVGGGFPSIRQSKETDPLPIIMQAIAKAVASEFGKPPSLLCAPGRGLIAEACTLAVRVKSIDADDVTLNDGIYGGLSEFRDIYPIDRLEVISPDGRSRNAATITRPVFGPTCDSLDSLPGGMTLPADIEEEDYILIKGMGAYVIGIGSRFNGYGAIETVTVSAP